MLRLSLPTAVPPEFVTFATPEHPLRPSKNSKFGGCPMSIILSMWEESRGNVAAQTGNLIHEAVAAFHKAKGDRVAAGLKALDAARAQFPEGEVKRAEKVFRSYAADPANADADVVWAEEPVRLTLEPAPEDPTGKPVVIQGTLDQVRRDPKTGLLTVWDVKTGDRFTGEETVLESTIQQATYTLAARQTLDPAIEVGGIIYTPAYEKARSKKLLPLKLTVDLCTLLVSPLVHWVAEVRRGVARFRPSAESCRFCPHAPFPACAGEARRLFGLST